ncbi:MAG: AroM family protein [archaeon]
MKSLKVGFVTVGQSPRVDVVPQIARLTGDGLEYSECGALDSLSLDQIKKLAPRAGEYLLVTRLRDGTSVEISRRRIMKYVQDCMTQLENSGVDLTVMLCTGDFPELKSKHPILMSDRLLSSFIDSLQLTGGLGVVIPDKKQISQARQRWSRPGRTIRLEAASPYQRMHSIVQAARRLARSPPDIVVLDCIGFSPEMKENIKRIVKRPVLLPSSIIARMLAELS